MTPYKRLALAVLAVAVIAVGTAGAIPAGEPQRHVVGENEIQARIDQQISQTDADRQAIQTMLQREDVRQFAGAAGLDLERASAAAAVLSGPSLDKLATQARAINGDFTGGDSKVVISATALIIILLILILLAN
ncbi:MAG: PA2779 family protein [Planctomycetes bacterium]|nr:PA2779 family protein [Planctomycetota bacterium]